MGEARFNFFTPLGACYFILLSKMRSANEVTLVDAVYGTSLSACAAAGTEIVIDGREVVLYGDSTLRTGLLALHTADTAVGAILTGESTLILVGALNDNARGIVDEVDDTVGALTNADATADTLAGVNVCYTVFDGYSILGTNARAVTVAKASIGTELVAAVRHVCGKAGLVTLVVTLSGCNIACAVAGNVCNLLYNVLSLNTEDSCDLPCGTVTAGNTEVGLVGRLFCESLCVAVASGVTASAAVCTGQAVTDSEGGLVLLNSEEDARYGKNRCAYNTDAEKEKNGNENI